MLASATTIIEFLSKTKSYFDIPLYQREYVWDKKKQLEPLLFDINSHIEVNKYNDKINNLCMGTIIVEKQVDWETKYTIVDGQQRITTFTLMLLAIRDAILNNESIDKNSFDVQEILRVIACCTKLKENKIKLSKAENEEILSKLVFQSKLNQDDKKTSFYENYLYFYKKFSTQKFEWIQEFFVSGLQTLQIVLIELEEYDNAYDIFESFNSRGKVLTGSELIKNLFATKIKNKNEFIDIKESIFDVLTKQNIDVDFFRSWMAVQTGILCPSKGTFKFFKDFMREKTNNFNREEITIFSNQLKKDVKLFFWIKNELENILFKNEINTIRPLFKTNFNNFFSIIFAIVSKGVEIDSYNNINIKPEEFNNIKECLIKLTRLLIGRVLVNKGRVEANRTFAKLGSKMYHNKKSLLDAFNESVWLELTLFNSEKNYAMPKEKDIFEISEKNVYDRHKNVIKYVFVCIEEHLTKKIISNEEIEKILLGQIMPSKLFGERIDQLKSYDNNYYEAKEWVDTIGNLTLISNDDNIKKLNSNLELTNDLINELNKFDIGKKISDFNNWNLDSIKYRTSKIFDQIKSIWWNK